MELVIMCQERTPQEVRQIIESRPGTNIHWRGEDWRFSFGFGPNVYLDFMYLAEFHSPAQWQEHLDNLRSFVRQHASAEEQLSRFLALIEQQTFALTVQAEPDVDDWQDDRLLAIAEYAQDFGSFLCSSKGLFATNLQPLLCGPGTWDRTFIDRKIENCCLYFPTETIPFQDVLPGMTSDGDDLHPPSWYEYESEEGRVRLHIGQDDLEDHKLGFRGYVAQLANPAADRAHAQTLIQNIRLVVGVELPGSVSPERRAFAVLQELIRRYEGFLFVADGILLPNGSFLVGPLAPQDEQAGHPAEPVLRQVDPEDYRHLVSSEGVNPERVAMRERHYCLLAERGFTCVRSLPLARSESHQDHLRPIPEIAARVSALNALFLWVSAPAEIFPGDRLQAFVQHNKLSQWLTEEEQTILETPREDAHQENVDSVGWKLENMWALSWILGFEPAPKFYQGQISSEIIQAMTLNFLPRLEGTLEDFLGGTNPRSAEAVGELEDLFYCAHNAVRCAQFGNPTAVPANFHPVVAGGAVHERRHALTWALSPGVDWEETDLST